MVDWKGLVHKDQLHIFSNRGKLFEHFVGEPIQVTVEEVTGLSVLDSLVWLLHDELQGMNEVFATISGERRDNPWCGAFGFGNEQFPRSFQS